MNESRSKGRDLFFVVIVVVFVVGTGRDLYLQQIQQYQQYQKKNTSHLPFTNHL